MPTVLFTGAKPAVYININQTFISHHKIEENNKLKIYTKASKQNHNNKPN